MKPIVRIANDRIEFAELQTAEDLESFRQALQIMAQVTLEFRGIPCEFKKVQALDDAGLIDWDASE